MAPNAGKLSYEAKEPAFLRRLRAEHEGGGSDRHERPLARPRKQMKDGEEDDQPTYVVEDGLNTLSKAEYGALIKQHEREKDRQTDLSLSGKGDNVAHSIADVAGGKGIFTNEVEPVKQHIAAIGGSSKRRLAKVVGDEANEVVRSNQEGSAQQLKTPTAKKAKQVKLSFEEDVTGTR